MQILREAYQSWEILVNPIEGQWRFSCLEPDSGEALSNQEFYPSYDAARDAAHRFVDRLRLRCQINDLLEAWLVENRITFQQYTTISGLIGALNRL